MPIDIEKALAVCEKASKSYELIESHEEGYDWAQGYGWEMLLEFEKALEELATAREKAVKYDGLCH